MYRVEKVEVPGVTTRVVDWVLAVPLPGQDWARAAGQGRRAAGLQGRRGEGARAGYPELCVRRGTEKAGGKGPPK